MKAVSTCVSCLNPWFMQITYNIGFGNFARSTAIKYIGRPENFIHICSHVIKKGWKTFRHSWEASLSWSRDSQDEWKCGGVTFVSGEILALRPTLCYQIQCHIQEDRIKNIKRPLRNRNLVNSLFFCCNNLRWKIIFPFSKNWIFLIHLCIHLYIDNHEICRHDYWRDLKPNLLYVFW